jgi:5'(3')-deoxyribonucleotidase
MDSSRPTIAIDIDDVLFPFAPGLAEFHNLKKGTTLTSEDFNDYDFTKVWGGTREETNTIIEDFFESDYIHLSPVDGAKSALEQLNKDFNIVLVTARNEAFKLGTVKWLTARLPQLFNHVMFAGNHHDGRGYRQKGEICYELGASLLIDDHPMNIASAMRYGVGGIVFSDKEWSVLDGLPDSAVHCSDWPAVLEYIYNEWSI